MFASRKRWYGAVFMCLVVLAAISGGVSTSPSSAQAPPTSGDWQVVPNVPADIDFRNVFMASVDSGIAVGKQGDKGVAYELKWTPVDGSRSSLQISPVIFDFRAPLHAAVMVNDDVWIVGERGLIVRKHNGIWSEVASPVPDAQLLTLQMLGDGSEGWAGGFERRPGSQKPNPVLLHFTSGEWKRDNSITGEGTVNALHFGPGGGWAVGDAGIWRYFRGEWSKEQEPNPCPETGCFPTYYAVRAINADEAWVAGYIRGLCGICVPEPYILHREGGKWRIAVDIFVPGDPTHPGAGIEILSLTFTASDPDRPPLGWAVGRTRHRGDYEPYILSHEGSQAPSQWHYVPYPAGVSAQLTSVSAPDRDHAVIVGTRGTILSFGYGPQQATARTPGTASPTVSGPTAAPTAPGGANPVQRVPDPHEDGVVYFELVGHTLRGGFLSYWRGNGGLEQFGYPLTEEFTETSPTDGKPYLTQYFERARFEYHPENKPPYDVLLGLLGRTITAGREGDAPFKRATRQTGMMYFDATGHNVPPQFSEYWEQHGGLPVYGYPISEAFSEVSRTDGKPYLVQYFERNRLEYHPELPEPFRVSLGLLGVQVLQQRDWIPGGTPDR